MANNGRDETGRFAPGHGGGPGRPRGGITDALRRLVDPDKIAAFVYGVLDDPKASKADKRWACEMITDRLDGRAVSYSVSAHVSPESILPSNWDQLTSADRDRWLDAYRAARLASGD